MGEGTVSVDIAQGEDTLRAGPAKVVDLDVPPFVELDTRRLSVEQVRVRDSPNRDEKVRAGQLALVATLLDGDRYAGAIGATLVALESRLTLMPSSSRMSLMDSATSASSRNTS